MDSRSAQRVFLEFLEAQRRGEKPTFEHFCAAHPELRQDLCRLHSSWRDVTVVQGDFAERLRSALGDDVDPGISLDAEPESRAAKVPGDTIDLIEKVASMSSSGRYSIKEEVARGGMGRIYKVWDRDLRRTLAMKVVLGKDGGKDDSSSSVDRERLGRFLEEAQITGQLDHPGIVPVHEMGLDPSGRVYFTMRLVKGEELRAVLRKYPEGVTGGDLTRAVQVVIKVCEAVAFAHEKGVVHRDLKPANIMVGRFGEVYVMDWGLAKVVGREERTSDAATTDAAPTLVGTDRAGSSVMETVQGAVFGTPCYMAPEQARGDVDAIGPWSDTYAVGSILYHVLTGRMPYVAPGERKLPHAILAKLLEGPPTPVAECKPDAQGELTAICEKAMQREPSRRYASMMEMKADLQAWLEGRVVRAYETGAFAEFRKWVARNKGTAGAVASLVVVLISGAMGFAWQQTRQAQRIAREQQATLEAKTAAEANERRARRQSYVANLMAADVHLRTNEVQEAKRRLEDCDESLRGWEWRHLAVKADSSVTALAHDSEVLSVAVAPALFRVATGCGDYSIRLWDPDGRTEVATLRGHSGAVVSLTFSPDGSRLVSGSDDGTARIWDVASGQNLQALRGHEATVTCVRWDASQARVVSAGRDGHVRVWDADTGRELMAIEVGDQPVEALAVSPDGARLASGGGDGRVVLWDGETGTALVETDGHASQVTALAFSPDGRLLASASSDGHTVLWHAGDGQALLELQGHPDPVLCLGFSPDGEQLVTGSLDKTVRVVDSASGKVAAVLNGHEAAVRSVTFADDGAHIVSGSSDRTARLWVGGIGAASTGLNLEGEPVAALALDGSGRRLAVGARLSGDIRIWDALSGTLQVEIPGPDDAVLSLAFTPDGQWLLAGLENSSAVLVLDAFDGERRLGPLVGHDGSVNALAVSPDGETVASASADGTVRLWDPTHGSLQHVLEGHTAPVTTVAFVRDGAGVAAGAMDGWLRTWDARSGDLLLEIEAHPDSLRALAADPQGRTLASSSLAGIIRLWDAASGELLGELSGHGDAVFALAFGPGGTRLVSGSRDKSLMIWDIAAGTALLSLRGHDGPVVAAAFSPDDARIVSGAFDEEGGVIVWETASVAQRHTARLAAELVESRLVELGDPREVRAALESDRRLADGIRDEALRYLDVRSAR